ncbi:carbonic anhydrase-like [Macrobrachium rosenbergii]|uniref:carbonic anhydrase-like n=1 Tax=Macrobrachium rosenbergii TaxID=79674 RepID=UPI0034D419C4
MKVPVFAALILGLWTGLILAHRGGHGRRNERRRGSGRYWGHRYGFGGYYGGPQYYNYIEGPASPVSTTVNLSPGNTQLIRSSGYYRPSWTNYTQSWNLLAPGNTISVTCTYQFSSYTCQSPSLTVGESRYTNGYRTIGPINKQDSLSIVYTNQGGECIFTCTADVTSSGVTALPLDLQNPESWYLQYPKCGGSKQSPVNIQINSLSGNYPWKELGIHQYDTPPQSMRLSNDGRSAVLRVNGPYVMGGNLSFNSQYLLQDVVFHWGPTSTSGSEHTFNGQRYAGEMQFIHYNKKYANYNAALEAIDGLAILAVLMKDALSNNSVFNPVISGSKNIRASGSSTTVETFSLRSLLPSNTDEFYRYEGSLTRPGCQETATWTVFKTTVGISSAQLAEFRALADSQGNKITNNVRPVQSLNARKIYAGQLQ